ncbi:low molecular weight phosphatase family protein [Cesiribacter andamanensis]|uniref:Arsenate reductase n=1 Tax=Cesiribacter andamanensis AMV16 TaxID=1279009 RepID=M7N8V4_9BACT|nr:arsenate reductase [Cesiribacter andamanensis]EMR03641.1 Arsenate reductase [Cesiribacter andamanensis AMV16]
MTLTPSLASCVQELEQEFSQIPAARQQLLKQLAHWVRQKQAQGRPALLNFICTHNSRRSHLAQLWAQAAAAYYGIKEVHCFSGGTEATAFNPRAVKAMQAAGFQITAGTAGENPRYEVHYAEGAPPLQAWSKRFDDADNPSANFCAIMTCSDADENCPFVPGVEKRLALTYDDPKAFDDTPQEAEKYRERVRQIGREMLYAFSRL